MVAAQQDGHAAGLEFGVDGLIASSGRDNKVRIWDIDGKQQAETESTPDMVMDVVFNWNASRIIATADRSPLTASSAATCATLLTFEVLCDWKLIAAFMTSLGPSIQPTRHPVIA